MKTYSLNKTKFLLDTELNVLKETLNKYKVKHERDTLLINLALKTGARATEILNIEKSHLNDHDKTVLIFGLKGSQDREIPLPHDLYERIKAYSKTVLRNKLFPISYNYFREIWVQYRPVNKKLHSLRHTFAIELFKRTRDLRLVQLALGHRSINNTMVYANYLYSTEEMKKILE